MVKKEEMKIKNKYIEFWGRAILVAAVISLMMEWNTHWYHWIIWSILSIVLFLYVLNLKRDEKKK